MNATAITALSGAVPPVFGAALATRTLMDYLIYAGAIVLVTIIVTLWLATMRQPPLKHSDHRHRHHRSARSRLWAWFKGGDDSASNQKSRRRRTHRRRNPTLAETGGLPPLRKQPPSAAEPPPP